MQQTWWYHGSRTSQDTSLDLKQGDFGILLGQRQHTLRLQNSVDVDGRNTVLGVTRLERRIHMYPRVSQSPRLPLKRGPSPAMPLGKRAPQVLASSCEPSHSEGPPPDCAPRAIIVGWAGPIAAVGPAADGPDPRVLPIAHHLRFTTARPGSMVHMQRHAPSPLQPCRGSFFILQRWLGEEEKSGQREGAIAISNRFLGFLALR